MNRPLRVTGMSGAGNDFLVVGPEGVAAIGGDRARWAQRVCARGLSLGADGVIFVEPRAAGRVAVQFVNPDGSSAFCGNGSRCAARFAQLEGLAGVTMTLETEAGDVGAEVRDEQVRLDLPPPRHLGEREADCAGIVHRGAFVEAGVPHFVCFVEDPAAAPLARWGPELSRHREFGPAGTNVNVARIDGSRLRLRTWERGVERETLCCGSGAVAAAAAARLRGAGERLEVLPAAGLPLRVELPGPAESPHRAILEGEARVLFRGEIDPEAWSWSG